MGKRHERKQLTESVEIVCWVDDDELFHVKERQTTGGMTIEMESTSQFHVEEIVLT